MPAMRFRRIWDREGERRARLSLPSVLIVVVLLLVGACGGDDESLNQSRMSDDSAPSVRPQPPAPTPGQAVVDGRTDGAGGGEVETSDTGITLRASVADNADDACVGAKEITVEPDALLFFCVEVANHGAIPLTEVEILSKDQRIGLSPFVVAEGDFAEIDPEGVLIATLIESVVDGRLAGQVAEEGLEVWLEAGATPVNAAGVELEEVLSDSKVVVQVRQDESPTAFASALGAGTHTLRSAASRFPLVPGFTVLFLAVLALMVATGGWFCGRRKAGRLPH